MAKETEEPEIALPAAEGEAYPVINPINGKIYSVDPKQIVVNVMVNSSKRAVFNIPVEGAAGELKGKILAGAMLALVTIAAACVPAIYSAVSAGHSAAEALKEAKDAAVEATPEAAGTASEKIMDQGSNSNPNATGNLASGASGSSGRSGGSAGPAFGSSTSGQSAPTQAQWEKDNPDIDPAVAQATNESYAMGSKPNAITDPSNRLQPDAETQRLINERDEANRKLAQERTAANQAEQKRQTADRTKAIEKARADNIAMAQTIAKSNAEYLARFDSQRRTAASTVSSYPSTGSSSASNSNNQQSNSSGSSGGSSSGGPNVSMPTNAAQTASSLASIAAQLSAIQDKVNVATQINP